MHPSHPGLQQARLEAEVEYEDDPTLVRSACQTVIKNVTRPQLTPPDQNTVGNIGYHIIYHTRSELSFPATVMNPATITAPWIHSSNYI